MRSRSCLVFMMAAVLCVLFMGPAAGQASVEWSELPELPQPLSGHFGGVSSGSLLLAGGAWFPVSLWEGGTKEWLSDVYVLPAPDASWSKAAPLAHSVAYGACGTWNGHVVCAGGSDGQQHFDEAFLLRINEAGAVENTPLPPLPSPCAYTSGAVVGDTMYVVGGQASTDSNTALHNFWAMDLTTCEGWQELAPWPGPGRILPVVAAQSGNLYLFSGADLAPDSEGKIRRTYLTDGYCYQPPGPGVLNAGWKTVAGPPNATVAAASAPWGSSHILVFSGDDGALVDRIQELRADHPGFTKGVLAYHTITDTWTPKGEMPETLVTTRAIPWDGGVVVPGGEDRPGHRSSSTFSARIPEPTARLSVIDFGVMGVYFLALIGMGYYFSKREKSTEDFFLGGRRVPWWAAGLSIYGTLLSAITFLATPANTFATNWLFYVGNLSLIVIAPIVNYVYLPFFHRTNITTAYEYLEKRFNVGVRMFGSVAFIVFQLSRVGIVVLLPAIALSATTGINLYGAILAMGILCTIYTVMGGIEAVIWTDVLQVIVLLGGAALALITIIFSVDGGVSTIIHEGMAADKFRVANWGWDVTAKVFWVVALGRFLEALIPYVSDQTVVQRYLTTSSEKEARKSIWLGLLFSLPNAIMFFGLGTALFVFYKTHPHMLEPSIKTDAIVPLYIVQKLPTGIAGLVIAAVFAAAMSSLDSSLNSVSAVVVTDFYRRFARNPKEKDCLRLARWLTVGIGALGTSMALVLASLDIESLWQQYMKFIGMFGGSLAGLFALGIFTKRGNGAGALVGAFAGAATIFAVKQFTPVSFLLYSAIGICTCFTVGYVVSQAFPRTERELSGLTWWTMKG